MGRWVRGCSARRGRGERDDARARGALDGFASARPTDISELIASDDGLGLGLEG